MTAAEAPRPSAYEDLIEAKFTFICQKTFRGATCHRDTKVRVPYRLMKEGIEITCPRCQQVTVLD